jgi:hypothetical protein
VPPLPTVTQSEVDEQERPFKASPARDVPVPVHTLPPSVVEKVVRSGGTPWVMAPSTTQCDVVGQEMTSG